MISTIIFTKPALSLDEQVKMLIDRGLKISDVDAAKVFLSHSNYYRFVNYGAHFCKVRNNYAGITFEAIVELYKFDASLCRLLQDILKTIELSFRSNLAYSMARNLGPQCLTNYPFRCNFSGELAAQLCRSKEPFIQHYRSKYALVIPPVWAAFEIVSFGLLSKIFSSVTASSVKKEIADTYGVPRGRVHTVFHHLVYVRNICAHHSMIWDRRMKVLLGNMARPIFISEFNAKALQSVHPTLLLLLHLSTVVPTPITWRKELLDLLMSHTKFLPKMCITESTLKSPPWT